MTAAVSGATWQAILKQTKERIGNETEARWLVEEVSGYSWPEIHSLGAPAPVAAERAIARLDEMVERRAAGEPIQYVLGRWPFRTLDLMVDPRVLIPRPETEHVVGVALDELDALRSNGAGPGGEQIVVDLGTGSGAIGLSVASERSHTRVFATDVSPAALEVASANLAGLGGRAATRVRLLAGDWWSALPSRLAGRVDLVVSNPPYVSTSEMPALDQTVRDWEPTGALESGPTGLEAIEKVLAGAAGGWLRPGGSAVLEIAPHQSRSALDIASKAGFPESVVMADLAGRDRVLLARGAR